MRGVTSPVDVLLIGIGGYGRNYLRGLENLPQARLCAVVDPFGHESPDWPTLEAEGVPLYPTLEAFLNAGGMAELAVIASPLAFHAEQTCAMLEAGMNILCEKPLCPTVAEAHRVLSARNESGKFLEVGYQWSFNAPIQQLKADILRGLMGRPRQFLTYVAWPRSSQYYSRNNWAGHICDPVGRLVYDSPVNNATAHYLHNMLFLAGLSLDRSAEPTSITAECYRGNPIENFDTACCRVETRDGPEILFYTTHCVLENVGPVFRFEFEHAQVQYTTGGEITATFYNGQQKRYGDPDLDNMGKLRHCLQRCRNPNTCTSVCGPEAAIAHTHCVEGIQQVPINNLPEELLCKKHIGLNETLRYMPTLGDELHRCFSQGKLLSEAGVSWSKPATRIALRGL